MSKKIEKLVTVIGILANEDEENHWFSDESYKQSIFEVEEFLKDRENSKQEIKEIIINQREKRVNKLRDEFLDKICRDYNIPGDDEIVGDLYYMFNMIKNELL